MSQSVATAVPLKAAQLDQGTGILARAFKDDPMMRYFVADDDRLLDKPMSFYRANIRLAMMDGKVLTTPSLDGIAVWVAPGNTDFTMGQMFRSGLLLAVLRMGPVTIRRFMRSYSHFEHVKNQVITAPHWVLVFLGVEPSRQGRGLGGVLIRPVLEQADAEGIACYLDSTNERNLTFYHRHGFTVAAEGEVPNGPKIWAMLRQPGGQPVST